MLKYIYLIAWTILVNSAIAQNNYSHEVTDWFLKKGPESYMDISSGFYYDECSYLGVFGGKKHKINIRFDSVKEQGASKNYYVEGKSLLNKKITSFKGVIHVEHLDLLHVPELFYEVIVVATGTYMLTEEEGGVFKGVFRKYFSYRKDNQTFKDASMEVSDHEGFAGVWIDPANDKEYDCHFGFHRYPLSLVGDFEINGGEPSINPDYKKYGWKEYFEKREDHGFYGNTECSYDWWK